MVKKWGYSFDELVEMLDKTLELSPAANEPYVMLTHVRTCMLLLTFRQRDYKASCCR